MQRATELTTTRHNELIDPQLHIWGWEVPVYLFLGGLVAGLLVWSAILELWGDRPKTRALQWMPFISMILLSLGMGALLLDLEYKLHAYRFYLAIRPASPMSWGAWILVLVYPAAILMGLGSLSASDRARVGRLRLSRIFTWADAHRRAILWTNVALGSALGIYTGILLGSLGARPLWNSGVLGPLFLVSGLSTGAAFMILFRPRHDENQKLLRGDVVFIIVELLLIGLLLIDLVTGSSTSQSAAALLFGGSWTGVFWALVVFAGLLIPLLMEILELRNRAAPTVLSAVLVLIGGFSLRMVLVMAGQQSTYGVF
jgi:formate-dependent nitrite reductase membrane component NrfD